MDVNWRDRSGCDRRRFFQLMALGVPAAVALGSCGVKGITPKPYSQRTARDQSADHTLLWSNWPYYIDINPHSRSDADKYPTLNKFRKETGVQVTYSEDISDNDVYFGKIRPLLTTGAYPGSDLMVFTDWMVGRLKRYGWIQPLSHENIPNLQKLNSHFARNTFDPDLELSAPYVYGLISIAYNKKATGGRPVKSLDQMLHDPLLRGKVSFLSEMESTMSLVMIDQGIDPANFTGADFDKSLAVVQKAIDNQQIRAFTGNEYTEGLDKGDYAASIVYSGDVVQMQDTNPDIVFVTPDSGAKLYTDNFVIPSYSRHKLNAEKLINFYYDPANSAQLHAAIKYLDYIEGSYEVMEKIAPDVAQNPLVFPPEKDIGKYKMFKALTAAEELDYFGRYQRLIGV